MFNKKTVTLTIILFLLTVGTITVMGASVSPQLFDPWQSGNAEFECEQAGCNAEFAYKVDDWDSDDPNGDHTHGGNTISITAYEDPEEEGEFLSFDWESDNPVYCVIVSRGNIANVYKYPGGALSDTNLVAPGSHAISHATFCWDSDEPETCTIIVEKKIDWGIGSYYYNTPLFDFELSSTLPGFAVSEFSLGDGDSRTFPSLEPGKYIVVEDLMGWGNAEIKIKGGSYDDTLHGDTVEVEIEAGDTVTIIWINRPPDYVIPETPLGVMGSLLAMMAVVLAVQKLKIRPISN
jgi:hypothetical protein